MGIIKIISGGQTGADLGGLIGARRCGVKTAGFAPRGWMTEEGPQEEVLRDFGLFAIEGPFLGGKSYRERTTLNIKASDLTVCFGVIGPQAPGTSLTIQYCSELEKPWKHIEFSGWVNREIDNHHKIRHAVGRLDEAIIMADAHVINIAGNRESITPGICEFVARVVAGACCIHAMRP